MKIIKTISTTILSVLLISSIGILSSIAIDENTKSISDILRACSPQYVDKDIIVNGVKYNIFFDARDEYCIEMPTAAVKDILSTNATVKIKADIKCDEYPFSFALTHCYFDTSNNKRPKCAKTCKKLVVADGVEFIGGFNKWTKLEEIVCGKYVSSISGITNCKKLKSIKTCSTVDYISKISNCKKLSNFKIGNKKKAPKIEKNAFKNTKKGIKFYVKNKKVAKSLKKQLKGSGVKKAKILVGKKVVYKNVK